VREADLAVLLEPTDLTIQAGCLGNLSARVRFRGVSGHSARPWLAENAIHAAVEGLARIATLERREAVIDGLTFYEVASVTRIEAGVADNVVPDTAVATVNLRYAPDRTPDEAETLLRSLVPTDATWRSPATHLRARSRSTRRCPRARGRRRRSRSSRSRPGRTSRTSPRAGIPAVNFGPGATRYAHRRDELVEIAALERAYDSRSRQRSALARRSIYRPACRSPHAPRAGDVPVRPPQRVRRPRRAPGLEVIDFGMGDPREPTDPAILQALRDGVRERWATRPVARASRAPRRRSPHGSGDPHRVELDPSGT
jgi:hypothetical protein